MEIKRLRTERKLTQAQVAASLGVAANTYAQYESGIRKLSPENICLLADLFQVSTDELLGRTPQLFDDARVPKTEVQDLFDRLNVVDQGRVLGYMYSILEGYGDISKRRAN